MKLEDEHHQCVINYVDCDLILRVNDEGIEHTSFDLFNYEKQTVVYSSPDVGLARAIIKLNRD